MSQKRVPDPGPGLFGDLDPPQPPAPAPPAFRLYCQVALNRPVRTQFTYGVGVDLDAEVLPGVRVQVPFGRRSEIGVVVGIELGTEVDARRLKGIQRVLDEEPLLDPSLLGLTRWMADRYACSWGEALGAVLPATLRSGRSSRTVLIAQAAPGVGKLELAELDGRFPKQHRLLRTLLDASGPMELRDVLKRLNLSESPARTLAKRGWVVLKHERAIPDALDSRGGGGERLRPEALTEDQEIAVAAVERALAAGVHRAFLLQGVTGSGKTEVYLRAIERAQALGKGAIVLVPEISLTPQTVGWFRSRFEGVAVLHSRMTDAQRLDTWLRVRRGEARVVVGARSAIFAPVGELGVVVVDEEHEPSFKQQNVPRYHARDVAVERARRAGAVVMLGSATPALETWHAAREGELKLLRLPVRVRGAEPPKVEILDMRAEPKPGKGPRRSLFSRKLEYELGATLERGEQSILFLNRRGHTRVLFCPVCREAVRCKSCSASLTYHRRIDRVVCHLCCEESGPPPACPTCSAPGLQPLGAGIERVETEVRALLPGAEVRRMDSDTMVRFEDYTETLEAFGEGKIDVLVGTQMIAKGLDFPRVTLVGIIAGDGPLHIPDFRASERTHQLLAQVAGRAGRGALPGRILVQTDRPDHPALVQAARHDFDAFAREESLLRLDLGYPPFGRLIRVLFEGPNYKTVDTSTALCFSALKRALEGLGPELLGPAPAPIALVRGRHRRHFMVKASNEAGLDLARKWLVDSPGPKGDVRRTIDVDPVNVL